MCTEEELVETKGQLLEELQDIVENLDRARDLKLIGGLPVLLKLVTCKHSELRWRAAEVLSVCVQNNLEVRFHSNITYALFHTHVCIFGT